MKNKFGVLSLAAVLSAVLLVGCGTTTETTTESTTESTTETTTDSTTGSETTSDATNGEKPMRGNGGSGGGGLGGGSIDTSSIETQYLNIAYGTQSETQTLNIYLPNEGEGPYPVIIAIHGGGFMMGSNTGGDLSSMLEGVNNGYAVVTVNYRLSGEESFPGAISDVKAAIRYIKAHAEEYGLDADSIAVWGDSAGGNLAALAGTSGDTEELIGDNTENLEYSSEVQAVVDWFGPINFLTMDEQASENGTTSMFGATSSETSPESKYIGQLITEVPELVAQSNPTTYISSNDPYFYIQHGSADSNVPVQQSAEFAAALTEALGTEKVTFEILEGASHGGEQFDAEENLNNIFTWLDSILK